MDLRRIIRESIEEVLDESRIVTFNGQIYPEFGWCVVLAGGGGSGKGYVLNHSIPINGKVIDVDNFKQLFVRMHGNMINGEKYNSLNPKHVALIHNQVKKHNIKGKYKNNILMQDAHNPERLPNIIFDMTAKNPNKDVIKEVEQAKSIGYKTMIVWVVSNRNEALMRNLSRPRRVPDSVLHGAHNDLANNMPPFLKSSVAARYLDEAWLVFGSAEDISSGEIVGDAAKEIAVPLTKTSSGFIINNNTMNKIKRYLGRNEESPNDLKTYLSSDEIARRYGKEKFNKEGEFNGFSFDRKQFNKDSNFYR